MRGWNPNQNGIVSCLKLLKELVLQITWLSESWIDAHKIVGNRHLMTHGVVILALRTDCKPHKSKPSIQK